MKDLAALLLLTLSAGFLHAQRSGMHAAHLQILYSPGHPANRIVPAKSFGAALDGHEAGDIDRIMTRENIQAMKAMDFGPLAYRLRTELGVEAWHWNPHGKWSDGVRQQGYWVSDNRSNSEIQVCNGFRLPRRGNTHDQANDDGYSRIDDGDTSTFWKSNPYLDTHFTNDSNGLHPQWVVIDLGKLYAVNAVRIHWGNPYALAYKVDYALDIGHDYFDPLQPDLWHGLGKGDVTDQDGQNNVVVVSDSVIKLRFIRITMTEGSGTTDTYSADVRDKLGFAIKEVAVGLFNKGKFRDYVKHVANNDKQSVVHVSSTDPWHRATDIDVNTEQPGIDRFFKSGLVGDEPTLMPIALLYDNPENMVSLLQYVRDKKYNVKEFEMGEEPEGQLVDPQDYASLYCQWATALKKIDNTLRFGGPGFAALATTGQDQYSFTEQNWTQLFCNYLKEHNRLTDFNFFTFEWYPFDDVCAPTAPQLAANPEMLSNALKDLQQKILPPQTPVYVTEYGYSSHSGKAQVEIEGALMYADILGKALSLGVSKAYLYGYEPTTLDEYNSCSWGNNMLFAMSDSGRIAYHTAAYYGMNMLIHFWSIPRDSTMDVYPMQCDVKNEDGQELVSAYAIRNSQNKWSIILINKDPKNEWDAEIGIVDGSAKDNPALHFPLHLSQYSSSQYEWKAGGSKGHPTLEMPPNTLVAFKNSIPLPAYSLTIVREN